MKYAERVKRLSGEGSAAWQIHSAARARQAAGEDIVVLTIGDPDFNTPESITDAAVQALRDGDTHYTEIIGTAALRRAIAERASPMMGREVQPDEVCVTAGAQNGLFVASLLCLDPDDEVVVLEPAYVTYEATLGVSGAVPVHAAPADAFRPDIDAIARAITPRTRAIMFANPNNPTGVAMTEEELAGIASLARQHNLWVISDEVYNGLGYDRPHVCIASLPGMAERTVTISSVSKTHAMTGWRLGWIIAPQLMVQHAHNLSLAMLYGLPGFTQKAGLIAIAEADEITARMRETYRARREVLLSALGDAEGVRPIVPDAGMFMLLDVRGTGLSSRDFAWGLLEAEGVSVLDGAAFGASAAGHVRVACTIGEDAMREGGRRIARYCQSLAARRRGQSA